MPITALTVENFKGIRDPIRIEFRPITLLFGPNSSGKSTILQALHYAREIFERQNLDPGRTIAGGTFLDLGGFQNIIHGHDLSQALSLCFDLDLSNEDLPDYPTETIAPEFVDRWEGLSSINSARVEVEVRWNQLLERPLVTAYEVTINGETMGRIRASEDGRQIFLSFMNFDHPLFLTESGEDSEGESFLASVWESLERSPTVGNAPHLNLPMDARPLSALPRWGKAVAFQEGLVESRVGSILTNEQFLGLMSALLVGPGEIVRDALRNFLYLGPLREIPSRNYELPRTPDESRWATGIGAWDILAKLGRFWADQVNEWLAREDRLDSGYEVEVKYYKELNVNSRLFLLLQENRLLDEIDDAKEELDRLPIKTRVLIREVATGIELSPQDVGVGVSQVIPVVSIALHASDGIVAVEQPELHVHPAMQVALGDLFISQIQDKEVTFLIETHSEHLLLRLLRRIREQYENELPPGVAGLTPEKLAIHYVVNRNQRIDVSELCVGKDGDSEGKWPEGFFEERHGELY